MKYKECSECIRYALWKNRFDRSRDSDRVDQCPFLNVRLSMSQWYVFECLHVRKWIVLVLTNSGSNLDWRSLVFQTLVFNTWPSCDGADIDAYCRTIHVDVWPPPLANRETAVFRFSNMIHDDKDGRPLRNALNLSNGMTYSTQSVFPLTFESSLKNLSQLV